MKTIHLLLIERKGIEIIILPFAIFISQCPRPGCSKIFCKSAVSLMTLDAMTYGRPSHLIMDHDL